MRPNGIILVTGPTGSGKTTTLYGCLNKINRPNINILTAEEYGLVNGDAIWIESPNGGQCRVQVKISDRVNKGLIFLPYHFAGEDAGTSRADHYPEGTAPYVLGAPANAVTNYGYDIITQMQETKTGLCRIRRA